MKLTDQTIENDLKNEQDGLLLYWIYTKAFNINKHSAKQSIKAALVQPYNRCLIPP